MPTSTSSIAISSVRLTFESAPVCPLVAPQSDTAESLLAPLEALIVVIVVVSSSISNSGSFHSYLALIFQIAQNVKVQETRCRPQFARGATVTIRPGAESCSSEGRETTIMPERNSEIPHVSFQGGPTRRGGGGHFARLIPILQSHFCIFCVCLSKTQGDSRLPVNGFVYFLQCSQTQRAAMAAAHSGGRLQNENHFLIYMRSALWPPDSASAVLDSTHFSCFSCCLRSRANEHRTF